MEKLSPKISSELKWIIQPIKDLGYEVSHIITPDENSNHLLHDFGYRIRKAPDTDNGILYTFDYAKIHDALDEVIDRLEDMGFVIGGIRFRMAYGAFKNKEEITMQDWIDRPSISTLLQKVEKYVNYNKVPPKNEFKDNRILNIIIKITDWKDPHKSEPTRFNRIKSFLNFK